MTPPKLTILSTVSSQFIKDWIDALSTLYSARELSDLFARAGLSPEQLHPQSRVTLDQIVKIYQCAAVETGDEMMGLWSRPIRPRALQHLLTSVKEAQSLSSAIYRFSTFWNLLLDDYQFVLCDGDDQFTLSLAPQGDFPPQRFGHMLILKLAHGLLSWLSGHEIPIKAVDFVFEQPEFHHDYTIVFPVRPAFSAAQTAITFAREDLGPAKPRTQQDLDVFLKNAPRDWIFTRSREHTQSMQVRAFLGQTQWDGATLGASAQAMNMTTRTLMRHLNAEGTSFQSIKDALRRDIAIRDLQKGRKSIEAIAQDVGFSSSANFHRAFRRWTGVTPSSYKNQRQETS